MHETNRAGGDEQVERALDELMRATDAFVTSWSAAVRRFAVEPAAMTRFRELHEVGLGPVVHSPIKPIAELAPHRGEHPLWDCYLDG